MRSEGDRRGWVSWVRPFVPPVVPALLNRLRGHAPTIHFTGDYPSWDAALAASNGYDDAAILARVRESAAKVRDGKAAFERDGVTFDKPEYNFPLLACLLRVASESGNRLRVLDFGGSLGSTYFQCRPFLGGLSELRWTVVEQPHFVECGRREFEDGRLQFRGEIDAVKPVDVALVSGVLQYLPQPYAVLNRLAAVGASWLIADRTGVVGGGRDHLTVQHVPAAIYGRPTSYPAWLFSRARLLASLASSWELVCDATGADGCLTWGATLAEFRFWFFRARGGEPCST